MKKTLHSIDFAVKNEDVKAQRWFFKDRTELHNVITQFAQEIKKRINQFDLSTNTDDS